MKMKNWNLYKMDFVVDFGSGLILAEGNFLNSEANFQFQFWIFPLKI
jgi:hypothetical protein